MTVESEAATADTEAALGGHVYFWINVGLSAARQGDGWAVYKINASPSPHITALEALMDILESIT
jgi:hypothetical protein